MISISCAFVLPSDFFSLFQRPQQLNKDSSVSGTQVGAVTVAADAEKNVHRKTRFKKKKIILLFLVCQ